MNTINWKRLTMRRNVISRFVLFSAIALLLTSCFTVEVESDFEEDGSGVHVYQATLEREAMEEFGGLSDEEEVQDDFEETERVARQMGYDVERIDNDEYLGVRLSRPYEDSENVGRILNDLFTLGADQPVTAFDGTFTQDGNTHTLDLTVNGSELFGDDIEEEEGISPAMLSAFITMTYTVRMPGEIDEDATNGRILPDGRVQWDLPLTGTENFVAVSETEGDGVGTLVLLGVIGLLILFIGGAALLALFLFLRSRRTEPAAAPVSPAGSVDPDAPTAPYPHATGDPNKPPTVNY
jgi:hypothetical protein